MVDTCTCCTCSLQDTARQGWARCRHSRSLQRRIMHLSAQKFVAFSPHLLGCIYTACTFRPGRTARLGWGRSRHSRSLNQRWMYKSNRFPIVLSDQETNECAFFGKRLIMMTHCNQVKTRASPQLVVSVYVITRPIHHLAAGTCTACTPGPAGRTRQR